jgi:hypothetical protein
MERPAKLRWMRKWGEDGDALSDHGSGHDQRYVACPRPPLPQALSSASPPLYLCPSAADGSERNRGSRTSLVRPWLHSYRYRRHQAAIASLTLPASGGKRSGGGPGQAARQRAMTLQPV